MTGGGTLADMAVEDEKPPGDEEPWSLGAGVPPLPGSDAAAGYERVRTLAPPELAKIADAGELLRRLSVTSPHQRLLDRYQALDHALREVLEPTTEALEARLLRASAALRAWARHAAELPANLAEAFGDLLGEGATTASEAWRVGEARELCSALAEAGGILHRGDGQLVAVASTAPPGGPVRVDQLIATVLGTSERIHCYVLVDAEPKLHDASRLLRTLESEVLLGEPLLMRMSGTKLELQELHADARTTAEAAVRAAKRVLAVAPSSTVAEAPGQLAEPAGGQAVASSRDGGTGSAPDSSAGVVESARTDEPEATAAAANESAPAMESAEPAESRGVPSPEVQPRPLPPVDLMAVAAVLCGSVSELERVWSDAVAPDEALDAAERDKQRFGGMAAALLRQTEEADERARDNGTRTIPDFPLNDEQLVALDPKQPMDPGPHVHLVPPLYVLQTFLHELQAISQPRELTFGTGGVVTHVAFDPGAVGRLKAHAVLLARCAEAGEAGGTSAAAGADAAWLRAAAMRAFDAGLPEAVVLYAHLGMAAGGNLRGLASVAASVCAHLAAGGTAREGLPVTIPLAYHLAAVFDEDDSQQGDDRGGAAAEGGGSAGGPGSRPTQPAEPPS